MPDVTLKPPSVSHTIGYGGGKFTFKRGVPATVSPELAEICRGTLDRHNRCIFDISEEDHSDIERILGVQLEFDSWPSASSLTQQ